MKITKCRWLENTEDGSWDGDCGAKWVLTDGTPVENKIRYCPVCGRPIQQKQAR